MLHCVFYTLFFGLFVNLSFGSLRFSQINRVFLSSYKGIYEASIITVDKNGDPTYPYFDQGTLRNYVYEFIGKNLDRYTTNYTLDVTFYKQDGVNKCSTSDLARNVKIALNADINVFYKYSKQQSFSIKDSETLWMINY